MGYATKLVAWGRDTALPFWLERGWDQQSGGFLEVVDLTGAPLVDTPRRVRVQARQIYVYARAEHEGWCKGLDRAAEAMALLEKRAFSPDGAPGWVHRLDATGEVLSPVRDLYDHAFILLALSWMYRVTGEAHYMSLIEQTLAFLDTHMSAPDRGFVESIGAAQLPRRQNPHMHLFEAMMALYEATGDAGVLDRIRTLRGLFDDIFFDPDAGVLREFFADGWHRDTSPIGDHVEPGHLAEWVWLLAEQARVTGDAADMAAIRALYDTVCTKGISAVTGGLFTTCTAEGEVLDAGTRAWMQTEWIRAAAVFAKRGADEAESRLEQACKAMFDIHLDPALAGGWIDQTDAKGNPTVTNMPSSTLYHALGAVLEARDVVTSIGQPTETQV